MARPSTNCRRRSKVVKDAAADEEHALQHHVLTPLALFLISSGIAPNIVDSSNPVRALALGANVLFALGVALWRPIKPILYGAVLAVTCCVVPFAIGAAWGNLGGLAVLVAAAWGLLVGGGAAILGSLLRRLKLPEWAAPGTVSVAVAVSVAMAVWRLGKTTEQSVAIIDVVQQIRQAELVYASQRSDHAFTCNGPDLAGLRNIDWGASAALGLREKNQARVEGHWLYLSCPPSAHPAWVDIVTDFSGQPLRVTR